MKLLMLVAEQLKSAGKLLNEFLKHGISEYHASPSSCSTIISAELKNTTSRNHKVLMNMILMI